MKTFFIILRFLKTAQGRATALLVLTGTSLFVVSAARKRAKKEEKPATFEKTVETRQRPFIPIADQSVDWSASGDQFGSGAGQGRAGDGPFRGTTGGDSVGTDRSTGSDGSGDDGFDTGAGWRRGSNARNFVPANGYTSLDEVARRLKAAEERPNSGDSQGDERGQRDNNSIDPDLQAELARLRLANARQRAQLLAPRDGASGNDAGDGAQNSVDDGQFSGIVLYGQDPKGDAAKSTATLSPDYAPYGRLITCQLINTIDSSLMDTPIIALVMEDVWHAGKIIIPAGTEVHGWTQSVTTRDRIGTQKNWVLVWRTRDKNNGQELMLDGLALDYTKDIKSGKFAITDGSAGLRGFEVQTEEYVHLKRYLAGFTEGASAGLTELLLRKATRSGNSTYVDSTVPSSSEENTDDEDKIVVAAGAQAAAEMAAEDLIAELSRNGTYVRVPAGTSFYLYVTQTIDLQFAKAGSTASRSLEDSKEEVDPLKEQSAAANELMNQLLSQQRAQSQTNVERQKLKETVRNHRTK